ncbi:uncharacterized protein N7518_005380 [Penicillium psychrosexuale]|uniref:uncharacterized protein n=1 Tax=Penicillium psychrosexuale TaxID=1002107 RepID=UPI0025453B17|nr:uncharacterized protein N7518_005380 [Penicillium psychrosexuale]KAJ5796840.1 hypothetical protein N7518_005380 [Penicillium psychrosexuale]
MDHYHPPTQVPDQVATPGFSSGETDRMLGPYVALQSDLDEAYKKYLEYADVIGRGDRLAPLVGDSILYPEVERTAARIFGEPRPRLVQGNVQVPTEWTDVLRESLTPGDFQRQENGMFLCRVRGSLIEVSDANYLEILTGVTERLLQPLQNLSDEQKETRVRLKLGAYLHQTHDNALSIRNNHVVENTNANLNSDVNARTEPSNLTSEMNVNSITSWLRNIDTSGDVGDDAESFGSNIPWPAQSEEASRSADTAAEQYGTRYRGVKRPRTDCSSSESESKPGAGTRYSPREEAGGPAFMKCLVDKGSTAAEIEEEYFKMFEVSRSASGLCKKFEIRGTWGMLKSHREAKMQRTMSS